MKLSKLKKIRCEIDGCNVTQQAALHFHHIIERKIIGTSNDPLNIGILCSVHHNLTHDGQLKIIGVYPSTGEQGRTLVYEINGVQNVPGITEPYYKPKQISMKIHKKEEK